MAEAINLGTKSTQDALTYGRIIHYTMYKLQNREAILYNFRLRRNPKKR
jgi:hypothetical protein